METDKRGRAPQDSGLPIYEKLVAGPQARKERLRRPLRGGKEADVYEATLLSIAETGPKSSISYDEIRTKLNMILEDKVPQKHEVTSALVARMSTVMYRAAKETAPCIQKKGGSSSGLLPINCRIVFTPIHETRTNERSTTNLGLAARPVSQSTIRSRGVAF
jgi:hypothetical protein